MPSPFPGMNPWLEGSLWPSFHAPFAVEITRVLNSTLDPRYAAIVEKQVLAEIVGDVEIITERFRPDVAMTRQHVAEGRAAYGTAVLDAPVRMASPRELVTNVYSVRILAVEGRELVTIIEILSPANKSGHNRADYLRKRRQILRSSANLVEIDLLRCGERLPMERALPEGAYFVLVHPEVARPSAGVWPISARDRLPRIPIPLRAPDPDIELDLQLVFAGSFEASGLGRVIDYTKPLDPPLGDADLEWARKLTAGLRDA